jgi:hypothetical protein
VVEGTKEVTRYWIGVQGNLFDPIPFAEQMNAQRKRVELIATFELNPEEVIIVRGNSVFNAVRRIQQWHAQVEASRMAEREEGETQ